MGQAQINVRTRACSRTSIARTRQAALTHNVRGKELRVFTVVHSLDIQTKNIINDDKMVVNANKNGCRAIESERMNR